MASLTITQRTTVHYTKASPRRPPVGIAIHNTVTTVVVAPAATGSWHFEIGRAGDTYQYVYAARDGHDLAWHIRACDRWRPAWMVNRDSRVSEPNSCMVGIELVSYAGNTAGVVVEPAYTDAQYAALRDLLALLYGWWGSIPVIGHGQVQADRSDPVRLDWARAGLVWKGDGYRYEGEEDMAKLQELQGQLDQANGVNAELQRQIDELRDTIGQRDSTIGALQHDVIAPLEQRVALMEGQVRDAVAAAVAAVQKPRRVEVVLDGEKRLTFLPEAA